MKPSLDGETGRSTLGTSLSRYLFACRDAAALIATVLLLLAIGGQPVCSQVTTATLYGTVTDPSQGAIAGATVTLLHEDTNATLSRVADGQGAFTFDFLRVGSYTVRIEAPGFKRYE
ncbi:MAG: carboxypeptidase-like regulatory domain-containing protein [Bryobacteraceae bacterium]